MLRQKSPVTRPVLRFASTSTQLPSAPAGSPPNSTKRQKKILITGGSRGIGAAIARKFANEGATCVLVGRSRSTLVDVASSLFQEPKDERHWSHVHGVKVGDVGSRSFWEELKTDESLVSPLLWSLRVEYAWGSQVM